ncbi:hypothetical protein P692DRAFT_201342899 [Suillus brevipes Sb2]|nr:hypothetical protein P692DRAFT_201342899 [Suillus brevipes Sb2]
MFVTAKQAIHQETYLLFVWAPVLSFVSSKKVDHMWRTGLPVFTKEVDTPVNHNRISQPQQFGPYFC